MNRKALNIIKVVVGILVCIVLGYCLFTCKAIAV